MGAAALFMTVATGCGNDVGAGSPDPNTRATPTDPETVANTRIISSVEGGGVTLSFVAHDTASGTIYSIEETGSAYAVNTAVDRLMAQPLTLLEVYNAVAGDKEAPEELVTLHSEECARLGRPDTAMLSLSVDLNAPVKKDLAACTGFVFADPGAGLGWTNRRAYFYNGSGACVKVTNGRQEYYFTANLVTLGLCNDSSVAQVGSVHWLHGWDRATGSSSFNVGSYTYWRTRNAASGPPACPLCAPPGTEWYICSDTAGASGYLATAEVYYKQY
jgi:hypothetical protein